ncbi:MAG: DUF1732 domain-containing protein, partial [Bacteroidota bacterium]
FGLYIEITGEETTSEVNKGLVLNYMEQLRELADGESLKLLELALRMPDAMKSDKTDIEDAERKAVLEATHTALSKMMDFRSEEGGVLEKDFVQRLATLRARLEDIKKLDPSRLDTIRERLERAVAELRVEIDANRFEQELIYYLEKYDITEEKVRLANHLDYFETTLNTEDSNGKKLGFITQEIGREINTIGSKANFAPMQQLVVQMKDELEKIKEQMLNVL